MANNSLTGHSAAQALDPDTTTIPMFNIERVQLQFSIASEFVAAQVANNVLVLALSNGRILRIDLEDPVDIEDIDLPKKVTEVGVIRRMFLDPTASHLIICTTLGENYYLHTKSRQPRPLSRLRGVSIEAIAWNPALPTISTREILIGASDGNIYEAYIETATEFYRKEEKFLKCLLKISDSSITGLWVDVIDEAQGPDFRRILITTENKLLHLAGKIGRVGTEGGASVYTRLFEIEQPIVHEISKVYSSATSELVISPNFLGRNPTENPSPERSFAWLSSQGTFYGPLFTSCISDLGSRTFSHAKMLPLSQLPASEPTSISQCKTPHDTINSIALTQWHIIHLIEGRVICTNQLDDRVIFNQVVLDPGQKSIGLYSDHQKNTFWLLTTEEIYEIVVSDEKRDIWKIMLQRHDFESAFKYARTVVQKDIISTASGDYLISKGLYTEAAVVYGKSSKSFEQVALGFIDNNQYDALRQYLLTKINMYKKLSVMQRMMIASWLVEIFMSKLNSLDDSIVTQSGGLESPLEQTKNQLDATRTEFQEFVKKYKSDIDKKTTYDIICSHGREDELIFFATTVNDYNYVLSYWMQRERWREALDLLKRQSNPDIFYHYSSALIIHVGVELVDILMRHSDLQPRNLIPALLNYNRATKDPLHLNQAVRYLLHCINKFNSTDAAVHNTLISIYASSSCKDETALLSYLNSQGEQPFYDSDFALRLCIRHSRIQSCVHIYSSMGQYFQAVNLALSHSAIDLASIIADRPISDPTLRKKLWLAVAEKYISQSNGIKAAMEFLKRCDLLKIEDLIPFFPDFIVIDDFKDEICTALEDYSRNIDSLKKEMDESSKTATNIRIDIAALDRRYAIVEPGDKCHTCSMPLLSRQFFVFPCQHAFHSNCLGKKVMESATVTKARRIRELQDLTTKDLPKGEVRDKIIAELDGLIAESCILCSDFAIKKIDMPFVLPTESLDSWAL